MTTAYFSHVFCARVLDGRPAGSSRLALRMVAAYRLDAKSQTQHYGSGGGGSTDIENQLRAVFIEADVDHSGYLSTKEFKQVCSLRTGPWKLLRPTLASLQLLKHADLGLSNAQIRLLMSEADENEDDQIDYNEFMIAVVQASLRRRLPHRRPRAARGSHSLAACGS